VQHNVAILKIVFGGQTVSGEGAEKGSQDIGERAWKDEVDQVFGMVAS
jgi:hypothetical protein